jgi:phosphinothricin acetyltransferase
VKEAIVSVRAAVEADLDAIHRIHNHAILTTTATWDEEPWAMERRRAWWAEHQAPGPEQPVLVAMHEREVVAFAYLTLMSQKSGWRFTRENTIYVDEPWRRKGVGGVLLESLLGEAERIGARLVVASITSDNEASLGLHARFGFEKVGTLKDAGWKFGRRHSTTYMQRLIGDA